MAQALAEAGLASAHGDVPIGAVVLDGSGAVIARAHNERELTGDPSAHAEVLALRRAAASVRSWRLDDCTLVVTLEPCTMCAGALVLARVKRLVFGAYDPKAGAVASLWDWRASNWARRRAAASQSGRSSRDRADSLSARGWSPALAAAVAMARWASAMPS